MRRRKQPVKKTEERNRRRTVSTSAPLVKNVRFYSAALDREMPYRIFLPRNYMKTTRRYPVLYLLHGVYGSFENWDTLTNLASHVAGLEWIIVMPDADDSWYTNSATAPRDRFEDYITKDVIAEVDGKYRTIRDRHARAVAGLSMGGYAALKFALRDPALFAFAGSLSGALAAARDLDAHASDLAPRLLEVFGAPGNPTRAHNDIFLLLQKTGAGQLPYFYLACGIGDSFLSANREFVAELSRLNLHYEYHETLGGHAWDYWDRSVKSVLSEMAKQLP
jgi:putative tributyrin esterase